MQSGKRVRIGLGVLVAMLSLAVGIGPSHAKEPLKIGGIFAVTGPASFLGDPEKKSLEMLVKEINDKGGIDGTPVEAVIYDTEGDPGKTVLAANKLISRDNVIAIIGPSLTPTTLAVVPVAEKAQVPLVSCAAGIKITEPVKPWVYKTAQTDAGAVATIYAFMQKKGIKSIGVISVDNAFGESGKEQLLAQASKFGIEVKLAESFGAKDTDMTAQLTKLRAVEPQAIVCWGTNPGPAVVTKNMKQLGLTMPLYQSHGVASPKFIELAGDAAEGVLLPTGKILVADQLPDTDPQKAVLLKYIKEYEKTWQIPVSGFGGYAYDAMNLLAAAMKGTNGKKDAIRANLEKISGHVGVSGVFTYTPTDHYGLTPDAFVMVEIKGGAWKLLGN